MFNQWRLLTYTDSDIVIDTRVPYQCTSRWREHENTHPCRECACLRSQPGGAPPRRPQPRLLDEHPQLREIQRLQHFLLLRHVLVRLAGSAGDSRSFWARLAEISPTTSSTRGGYPHFRELRACLLPDPMRSRRASPSNADGVLWQKSKQPRRSGQAKHRDSRTISEE